mmetsp:Transcript_2903/g.10515  ORF Transcript_2903/g.10515 Transcript_2903/m.10515 type:complete len:171 (-) Transcript_2903:164-676(-)
MALLAFLGRCMFATIFVLSAFSMYDEVSTGKTTTVDYIEPKLINFREKVIDTYVTPYIPAEVAKQVPPPVMATLEDTTKVTTYLFYAAIGLQFLGGLLFVLGSKFGALLLMTALVGITPIMHNFWDLKDTAEFGQELIQFLKNLALYGALLTYMFSATKTVVITDSKKKN